MEQSNANPAERPFTRRQMIAGTALAGIGLLALPQLAMSAPKAPAAVRLTMYRDPNCGCCGKWAEAARAAGLDVAIVATPDIMALKQKLGVPGSLYSCHTSVLGRYVVEGHVPIAAVKRLAMQKPAIRGIAVAGMPLGSPGMEVPGGDKQPFDVVAFDAAGRTRIF